MKIYFENMSTNTVSGDTDGKWRCVSYICFCTYVCAYCTCVLQNSIISFARYHLPCDTSSPLREEFSEAVALKALATRGLYRWDWLKTQRKCRGCRLQRKIPCCSVDKQRVTYCRMVVHCLDFAPLRHGDAEPPDALQTQVAIL